MSIFCEVDQGADGEPLDVATQAALYDAFEAATGLRFGLVVMSGDDRPESLRAALEGQAIAASVIDDLNIEGAIDSSGVVAVKGKSLHADLLLKWATPHAENLALRQRAADAICAIFWADVSVRDVARKRRMPSAIDIMGGKARVQTTLRAEKQSYFLIDVVERLDAYCREQGINVKERIEALKAINRARARAKQRRKQAGDASLRPSSMTSEQCLDDAVLLDGLAMNTRKDGKVSVEHRRILDGMPAFRLTTTQGVRQVASTDAGHIPEVLTLADGRVVRRDALDQALQSSGGRFNLVCPDGAGHMDNRWSTYAFIGSRGPIIKCDSCSASFTMPDDTVDSLDGVDGHLPVLDDSDEMNAEELEAARLLKLRDFEGVIRICVRSQNQTDHLFLLAHLAAIEEGQDEREKKRVLSLESFQARVQAKRLVAEALDPRLVEGAKAALNLARDVVGSVRASLRAQGMVVPEKATCGMALGTLNAVTGQLGAYRNACGTYSKCPICAPVVIARKIGAVLAMPVTDDKGVVIGVPMGERPVSVYTTDEEGLPSLLRTLKRRVPPA